MKSEWISASSRRPTIGYYVLLYPDFAGDFSVGELVEGDEPGESSYFEDTDGRRVPATHWMPLPEPPEDA